MSAGAAYRPEIDGLRALAVLPVLLFHAGFSGFSGGFIGVDIFFVVSGFLITGILLREMEEERFSLLKFYERRARRIFPALFVMALTILPFGMLLMTVDQRESLLKSAVALSFFASNVFFWLEDGYFSSASEEKPLLHSWTLAVEEQYYLAFPLMLMMLWPIGRSKITGIIGLVALLSFALCEWGSRYYPNANYYLLPGRAWEILAGSLCAFFLHRRDVGARDIPAAIGLICILVSIFTYTPDTPFPSYYTLLPVLGTLLILIFAGKGSYLGQILSLRPLVAMGLISYSLYLWHQPVFAFGRLLVLDMSFGLQWALVLLSILLATISYFLVEKPFRFRLLAHKTPGQFLLYAAIFPVVLAATAAVLMFAEKSRSDAAAFAGSDMGWHIDWPGETQAKTQRAILLYGDSHARQYAPQLKNLAESKGGRFAFQAEASCIRLPGVASLYNDDLSRACRNSYAKMLQMLERGAAGQTADRRPLLVIAQRWGPKLVDEVGKPIGQLDTDSHNAAERALTNGLNQMLDDLPNGQPTAIIGNVPGAWPGGRGLAQGPARCSQYLDVGCASQYNRDNAEQYRFNKALAEWAAEHANVTFIDPAEAFCADAFCRLGDDGGFYYSDDSHLSKHGVRRFMHRHRPTIEQLLLLPPKGE